MSRNTSQPFISFWRKRSGTRTGWPSRSSKSYRRVCRSHSLLDVKFVNQFRMEMDLLIQKAPWYFRKKNITFTNMLAAARRSHFRPTISLDHGKHQNLTKTFPARSSLFLSPSDIELDPETYLDFRGAKITTRMPPMITSAAKRYKPRARLLVASLM